MKPLDLDTGENQKKNLRLNFKIHLKDHLQGTSSLPKVIYILYIVIAVCLEVPTSDMQDIPIKNMYANVNFGSDNSFEDMLKVNNKVNISNFMKRNTEGIYCISISYR